MATSEDSPQGGQQPESTIKGLQGIARILGLRDNFLTDLLLDADDWSFVVKAHALLESIVCTLLAMHLRKRPLEEVLAEEVEMKARIGMTRALEITTGQDRKMMHALGNLRNRLVHNAKDTNFTFQEYLKNKDVRRTFSDTFGHLWPDTIPDEPPVTRSEYVAAHPKFAVFASVLHIAMYVMQELSRIQTEVALEGLRRAADAPDAESPEVQ
jgi:hypothetical protein